MIIDENMKIISLIDTYGGLLTNKQSTIMSSYYFDNLTLSEIADNHNISRQAVRDSISQSIKILNDYESKLHLVEKFSYIKNNLIEIKNLSTNDNLTNKINEIIEYID